MTAAPGVLLVDEAELGEEEGDGRRGEDLEEALDPEVDDPPAPVLHDGEVRLRREEEAGAVEEADGGRGAREHQDEGAGVVAAPRGREDRAEHQDEPEDEADEEGDLPDAPEVDVLVPLVAEPEAQVEREDLVDREVLPGERPGDDDEERAPEDVHAEALELRLVPSDDRGEEEARREEGGRDPEDAGLDVPGAREGVGEPLADRKAEERLPLDRVVRGERAEADLDGEEREDGADVLAAGAHRGGERETRERVRRRRRHRRLRLLAEGAPPDDGADAGEEEGDRDERPDDVRARRDVLDERLVRPVVRVGDRLPGALGRRGPARPEEEGRQRLSPRRRRGRSTPTSRSPAGASSARGRRRRGRRSGRRRASAPRPGRP